jgi:hypothetical protein
MTTWGLKRPYKVEEKNGWFYMLWPDGYKAGYGFRPIAGDLLKLWDSNGDVYTTKILEVKDFLYSSHAEVKLALGGIREHDVPYVTSRPTSGRCIAIRGELTSAQPEPCPISGQESWKGL